MPVTGLEKKIILFYAHAMIIWCSGETFRCQQLLAKGESM